ncbi:MAG: MerR family transcriptional regulator [Lachnospiraceae bacterium]|nr:MerR family transcriptional regulator [Lachnospiraceae bacterium]
MFSIGGFSKICQVSVKTLRHYDKIGLMRPKFTDPGTGYRYYSEEQLSGMLLIKRLKRYGFSLADIGPLLKETDERVLFLKLKQQKLALAERLSQTQEAIDELSRHLQDFERTGDVMSYQNNYVVTLEEREAVPILSVREKISVADYGGQYEKLFRRVIEEKLEADSQTLAIYHDEEFDQECSDVEIGLVMKRAEQSDRLLEGGLCATTVHHGRYSGLSDGYAAIVKWIQENGYRNVGAPYEFYRKTAFDKIPVEEWETKIYFPVEKAE